MSEPKASIGDIVLYGRRTIPSAPGEPNYRPRAALVVHPNRDGSMRICVFEHHETQFVDAKYSPEMKAGHWTRKP